MNKYFANLSLLVYPLLDFFSSKSASPYKRSLHQQAAKHLSLFIERIILAWFSCYKEIGFKA
jgi:hypothetical protein